MGGKSRSSQSTTNQQSTNNIVNDGDFAGANDLLYDESIIEDSYNTDSSTRLDDSFNTTTEYDDSFNTDNSVDYEDSFNTDNSIENDGDYAGNNGTINFVDAGSIDAARRIAERALVVNGEVVDDAFDFGSEALDEVQTVAVSAMENVKDFGNEAIDSLTAQSSDFAQNLTSVTNASISSNQLILDNIAAKSSEDNAVIAELARSTSLAGQDIVAKSSERMVMYIAIAVGIGFIAMTLKGGK